MAEHVEPAGLAGLRAVQTNVTVGQYVFFHHISQVVCGCLALFCQPVKSPRQKLDDQRYRRKQQRHHEHQFPVQKKQVGNECHQGEQVARQLHDGVHQ